MAESYKARVGKVWQNKKTKETFGNLLEITAPDRITNYSQVMATTHGKDSKNGKETQIFNQEVNK